jgi:acetate kinase
VGVKTRQPIWRFFAGKPVERYTFFEICARLDLDWQEIVVTSLLEEDDEPTSDKLETTSHTPDLASISMPPSLPVEADNRHYGLNESIHYYCGQRSAEVLKRDIKDLRLITCNLDGGCSLAAIHNGQIIDTATGFTPLEGLMIDYSSGSIDTNVLNEMMRQDNAPDNSSKKEVEQESSLVATSAKSNNPKSVGSAIDTDNSRAKQALDIYLHRLRSCLGSMLMSLGGMDAIVFTSELSENSEIVRELICQSLGFLGLKLDLKQNQNDPIDEDIATTSSKVRVLVINPQEA